MKTDSKFPPLTPIQRRIISASADIMSERTKQIDYLHTVQCQCVLPYRNPGEAVRTWDRRQGHATLRIEAGSALDPKTRQYVELGLPYGEKPRLVLIHLASEAIRTDSPVIDVEGSMTAFVRALGMETNGQQIKDLKAQLSRLAAASVRMGMVQDGRAYQVNTQIVTAFDLWYPNEPEQKMLWPSTVKLGLEFFQSLERHAVPLDHRAVRAIAHSSLALDTYTWLAQRLHRIPVGKPQFITWAAMYDQFGHVPLISTYWLSTAKGKLAWLQPEVDKHKLTYSFTVKTGTPPDGAQVRAGTKMGRGGKFRCILTDTPISNAHLKEQGVAKKLGYRLLAVVAAIPGGKVYLPADENQENAAKVAVPDDAPNESLRENARYLTPTIYGMRTMDSLFTPRQLVAMTTLARLVKEAVPDIEKDAGDSGLSADDARDYARAVATFLALALDRCADFNCGFSTWKPSGQQQMHLFTRQAISMAWDFTEANLLGEKAICWHNAVDICADAIESLAPRKAAPGSARQLDAAAGANGLSNLLVSTDPPYYDNVPYADISDFFYVWLRRTVGSFYPDVFSTVLVPKTQELTAAPERFDGDKEKAKEHFESGFRKAFLALREKMDPRFPLSVYYAFKQDDEDSGGEDSQESAGVDLTTGWETLLEALNGGGFQITGTWPVRASQAWRMRAMGSNALASYIVLACRPRPSNAPIATRKQMIASLRADLPKALRALQHGNIAPVDMAQSAIGPGMAIYTRYAKVVESDGSPMSVRTALGLINQVLDEVLAEQESEFDSDTRWALAWFEQQGMQDGPFGEADVLARAKNTAVNGLVEAGIIKAKGGKVQLLSRAELPEDWNPATDKRLTVWETTQHLIRVLESKGETEAADLLNRLGGLGETARDLAYRLFSICERKKWADEALAYNSLVIAWPELTKLALSGKTRQSSTTPNLFE